jgi:endonuclease-3
VRAPAQTRGRRASRSGARASPDLDIDIAAIIRRLRRTAPRWDRTALARIADATRNPFRILIACILSLRTQDTTTGPAAARLFALADTPEAMVRLSREAIARAIYPVGFYRTKARTILAICADLLGRFAGAVPDDLDQLLTLRGVGRKTANLVVTMGYGKPGICVDTHVHRISNRLGYVRTRTPEHTEMALRARLPRRFWIGYNDLLVAFGQNVCVPVSPRCSRCPVAALCRRVGVTSSR